MEGLRFSELWGPGSVYKLEEINARQRSLLLQRCASSMWMHTGIWALMRLCVYLRDL